MTSNVLRWRWWWLRPQFRDEPQNLLEHLPCDGDLGHLEDDIAAGFNPFAAYRCIFCRRMARAVNPRLSPDW
jgi:hypothetical protein